MYNLFYYNVILIAERMQKTLRLKLEFDVN